MGCLLCHVSLKGQGKWTVPCGQELGILWCFTGPFIVMFWSIVKVHYIFIVGVFCVKPVSEECSWMATHCSVILHWHFEQVEPNVGHLPSTQWLRSLSGLSVEAKFVGVSICLVVVWLLLLCLTAAMVLVYVVGAVDSCVLW